MRTPLLTVVVTSYNYERFITENLNSLISQWSEEAPFNILVFDDASTDGSMRILERYERKYDFITVKCHQGNKNKGIKETVKEAVGIVTSQWTTFLESDDLSQPGAIKRLLGLLSTEAGLIFCDIQPLGLDSSQPSWFYSYVPRMRSLMLSMEAHKKPQMLDCKILEENIMATFSCVAVRTHLLRQADFNCPVPEWIDWYLWIQICQKTKVLFVDERLVKWRIHADSLNQKKQFGSYLIKYRLFRKSIRHVLLNSEIKHKFYKITYLSFPIFVPLFLRFWRMSQYKGFKYALKQIKGRLLK